MDSAEFEEFGNSILCSDGPRLKKRTRDPSRIDKIRSRNDIQGDSKKHKFSSGTDFLSITGPNSKSSEVPQF